MWFPTVEQVIRIHDDILEATGGTSGVLNKGPIEAALARARTGPFRGPGDIAERAGLLLRGIVSDHPFIDGNKRTAFEIVDTFCERNGYRLEISQAEAFDLLLDVARREIGVEEIVRRLRTHLTRR